jgi:hypothetical protein
MTANPVVAVTLTVLGLVEFVLRLALVLVLMAAMAVLILPLITFLSFGGLEEIGNFLMPILWERL